MGYIEEENARLKKYQANKLSDCRLCVNWFLGCLNGREKWKDKAVTPNMRSAGRSGKEYLEGVKIPDIEYPLRMFCDAFRWDPNPERLGRAVY